MTITPEEMEALTQPFDLKDHQIREGAGRNKQQWLVYIDKIAVIKRLNAVFGGDWGNTIETRQLDGGVVAVDCHITIRGISRGLNGADSSSFNVHDVAKSAGSDAVKRALTMWGVGLYLYDVPRIYTDGGYGSGRDIDYTKRNAQEKEAFSKFANWYRQQFGNGQPQNTPSDLAKPQVKQTPKNAQTGTQGEPDVLWWADGLQVNNIINGAKNNDLTLFYLEMALGQAVTSYPTYEGAIGAIKTVMANNTDLIQFAISRYYNQLMDASIKSEFKALKHFTNWLDKHYGELGLHEAIDLLTFEANVFNLLKEKTA